MAVSAASSRLQPCGQAHFPAKFPWFFTASNTRTPCSSDRGASIEGRPYRLPFWPKRREPAYGLPIACEGHRCAADRSVRRSFWPARHPCGLLRFPCVSSAVSQLRQGIVLHQVEVRSALADVGASHSRAPLPASDGPVLAL